jgi:capsular polysaccharide export protein
LLQTGQFPPQLVNRAANLRRRIVASGITKYNVGQGAWLRPPHAHRVILVPGQVETDASLRYGAPAICRNLGLVQAVRQENPDSYVVYKPHPDVRAGLRAGGAGEQQASAWCDEILGDVPMGELLKQVDEVHVMTSLTGFEALLRQKIVVCYGLPFFAGWGLTRDILALTRRTRHLRLDELVAAALILYPIYFSYSTGASGTPEQALDDLCEHRDTAPTRFGAMRLLWRKALRLSVGAR